MLCLDKWSQKLVLIFITSGVVIGWLSHMPIKLTKESNDTHIVLGWLSHIPIKLTKESNDTHSFLNSYSGFPDHLTSIFDPCHHSTMSVPPNMGYESNMNTPVQITDSANAFIYSCLVLFSLFHISILVITVTFVLLDTFFSSYRNLVVQTRQCKHKTNGSTVNISGNIASLLFCPKLHHSKVFNCLVALFTTVPYLVDICCCYPDKSREILISIVNQLGWLSQILDKEWVFREEVALAMNLFGTVQFVTSVHILKARFFMQLLINSLCHFSPLVPHCDFLASETYFCLFMFIFVYLCLFLFIYVYFCLFMFIFVYFCLFMFIYVYFCLFMFIFVYLCLFLFIFVYFCLFM